MNMSGEIKNEKRLIRQEILRDLKNESQQELQKKSIGVCEKIIQLEEFQKNTVIAGFFPTPYEVNILPVLQKVLQKKCILVLSRINNENLTFYRVNTLTHEDLEIGELQMKQPKKTTQKYFSNEIGLVLVPGLAFDRHGNRLGRGLGYYDRFLQTLPKHTIAIGVCFETQIRQHIPHEQFDIPVQKVVTEDHIYF